MCLFSAHRDLASSPFIKTVLGDICASDVGVTLAHEHICCYSEYAYTMFGNRYLNKEKLREIAVKYLRELKETYALKTIVDCTPVNLGRDVELLKEISMSSGVNIVCSTGFYYTEEPLLCNISAETIAEYIVADAENVNAGIIKCAVEQENISPFEEKILRASAMAQPALGLPIILHTNANNQNGAKALEILLSEGVRPQAITVGHLGDTWDMEYVSKIANMGCFIGFDRLYNSTDDTYINRMVDNIKGLCKNGYPNQILLSHDALFFNGFEANPKIREKPRFSFCFASVLPKLSAQMAENLMIKNPCHMLCCNR